MVFFGLGGALVRKPWKGPAQGLVRGGIEVITDKVEASTKINAPRI